jgi:serine O-acetyltransferase
MRQDLRSAVERDPAARASWEVALLYPGLHAVWAHRVSHGLWRRGHHFSARALSQASRWGTGIEIHPGAVLGSGVFIDHGAGVVIGETAEVGDDVLIYHGVTLGGTTLAKGKRHPTIGSRVTIGAGAKILGNLTVGDDSRIGANAVLVRSVAEKSVVVGVPGQVVSARAADGVGRAQPNVPPRVDPVAMALASLRDRLEALERAQPAAAGDTRPERPADSADHLRMLAPGDWEADYSI